MNSMTRICAVSVAALLLVVSCQDLFTSSIGGPFERDSPPISSSASLGTLVTIAQTPDWASDPETAATVLDILANKDEATLLALSVDDQTAILNLAASAAIGTTTIANLANEATQPGAVVEDLVEAALQSFDGSVNLAAIESLLGNAATVSAAPAESLAMAAAVLVGDVANDLGADVAMAALDGNMTGLDAAQIDKINLARAVLAELEGRPAGEGSVTLGDFDLLDLLRGN